MSRKKASSSLRKRSSEDSDRGAPSSSSSSLLLLSFCGVTSRREASCVAVYRVSFSLASASSFPSSSGRVNSLLSKMISASAS